MSFNYISYPSAVVYYRRDPVGGNPERTGSAEVGIAREEGVGLVAYARYGRRDADAGLHVGSYTVAHVPVDDAGCGAASRKAVVELAKELAKAWAADFRSTPWLDAMGHSGGLIYELDRWPGFAVREGVTDDEIEYALGFTASAYRMLEPALHKLLRQADELARLDDDVDAELAAAAKDEAWRKAVEVDNGRDDD